MMAKDGKERQDTIVMITPTFFILIKRYETPISLEECIVLELRSVFCHSRTHQQRDHPHLRNNFELCSAHFYHKFMYCR